MERILIIDNNSQAEVLKSILSGDYNVMVSKSGREGIISAKSGKFALILLNASIPDMEEFALLKELEETMMKDHIPVILIANQADTPYIEKGLLMGAADYISRPFHPVIVKARVNAQMRLHRCQIQLQEQTLVDEMTGAANRRSYDRTSEIRWKEAVRMGLPFTLCMMDIDKFKAYNESYGRPAGDKVLASVVKTVTSHMRRVTDFFARYGGEEFAAIFTGNDAQSSYLFMQKIRQAVESLHIPNSPSDSPWITISCGGITIVPDKTDTYEECLRIADAMLKDAKESGRNMVVWSNGKEEQWKER